jgi:hypothetical protein
MPEMTPDPLAKLAKFTPAAVDPAELLFAAGHASACTPWVWKAAVGASLLVNLLCIGLLFRSSESPRVVLPEPTVVPAMPVVEPVPSLPAPTPDPWSYQALRVTGDLDRFPKSEADTAISHTGKPLSVLSARSGAID